MSKTKICETKAKAIEMLDEFLKYIAEYGELYRCLRELGYGEKYHPKTIKKALHFFSMVQRSLMFNVLFNLCRIHGMDRQSIGINSVFESILKNLDSYENMKDEDKREIKSEIEKFKDNFKDDKTLNSTIEKLKTLRDKRLAHFDEKFFFR